MMPGISGIDVCRTLRGESDVPIIMLTARDAEVDRVLGLELGADDYVTKPFSTAELVSRVRAILRRRELDRAARRRHRRSTLAASTSTSPARRRRSTGSRVELTPSEFRLLRMLAEEPERVFTRAADHGAPLAEPVRRRRAGVRRPHLEPQAQDRARSRASASASSPYARSATSSCPHDGPTAPGPCVSTRSENPQPAHTMGPADSATR